MTNTRDVIPDQNGTERLIESETEMASVESNPITVDAEKGVKRGKGMFSHDVLNKNKSSKSVSTTGYSAILFINNATEVNIIFNYLKYLIIF